MSTKAACFGLMAAAGCFAAEPTFELEPFAVETSQVARMGLQPVSVDSLITPNAFAANPSKVDAFGESLSLRVRHFLGGNNEPILRFRAFGSQNVPSTRSLDFWLDGTPLSWSDGWSYFGALPAAFIDTASAKPSGGATLGALSMGGVVSISGAASAARPASLALTVAEDQSAAAALFVRLGGESRAPLALHATSEKSDGPRPNNAVERHALWLAQSAVLGTATAASWHFMAIDHYYEVPGPLNPAQAAANPTSVSSGLIPGINAGFNIPRDRPRRDLQLWQCAVAIQSQLQAAVLSARAWVTGINDRFMRPVGFGGERGKGFDSGFKSTFAFARARSDWRMEVGARYGVLDTDLQHNEFGEWGSLWARHTHNAAAYHMGAEISTALHAKLRFGALAQIRHQRAWAKDLWSAPVFPTFQAVGIAPPQQPHVPFRYDETATQPTGAVWLDYTLTAQQTLQLKASYSVELPVYADRRTVVGGNPNRGPLGVIANPLVPQIVRTIEISHAWRSALFESQLNAYTSYLSNEILRGRSSSGADWALNAPATRHWGMEAKLSSTFVSSSGTWRASASAWYTNAHFHKHPMHGDGPIAGVPTTEFQTALEWTSASDRFLLRADVNWLPEELQVDNANTFSAPGYALLHLQLRWAITPDWQLMLACNNVLDRNYVSAVIVREQVAAPIQANYLPGTGRKVAVSIRRTW